MEDRLHLEQGWDWVAANVVERAPEFFWLVFVPAAVFVLIVSAVKRNRENAVR